MTQRLTDDELARIERAAREEIALDDAMLPRDGDHFVEPEDVIALVAEVKHLRAGRARLDAGLTELEQRIDADAEGWQLLAQVQQVRSAVETPPPTPLATGRWKQVDGEPNSWTIEMPEARERDELTEAWAASLNAVSGAILLSPSGSEYVRLPPDDLEAAAAIIRDEEKTNG